MRSDEIIILAGGKGSRLAPLNTGLPKCLSPVREKPFLHYIIAYYLQQGIRRFIFSLGHQHVPIVISLEQHFPDLDKTIIIENQPLDTGGAIRLAIPSVRNDDVFIANGDTYVEADLSVVVSLHKEKNSECTLALKAIPDTSRYGHVSILPDHTISAFEEKGRSGKGMINGGIYLLKKKEFMERDLPDVFSFEKDYLGRYVGEHRFYGSPQDGFFIDIGVPEDLFRAQQDMPAYAS